MNDHSDSAMSASLVISKLLFAITTATNDDCSKPGSRERDRFVEREAAMRGALDLIHELANHAQQLTDAEQAAYASGLAEGRALGITVMGG